MRGCFFRLDWRGMRHVRTRDLILISMAPFQMFHVTVITTFCQTKGIPNQGPAQGTIVSGHIAQLHGPRLLGFAI